MNNINKQYESDNTSNSDKRNKGQMCVGIRPYDKGNVRREASTFTYNEVARLIILLCLCCFFILLGQVFGFEGNILAFILCYIIALIIGILIGFLVNKVCPRKTFRDQAIARDQE